MITRLLRKVLVLSITVVLSVVVLSEPARATLLAYESFTLSFPIYAGGGTGFSAPWVQGGFFVVAAGYTTQERSLCYPKFPNGGGSVSGHAFADLNGITRDLTQTLGTTTVYISFLIQPEGILNEGLFSGFFGLTLNGSLGPNLFVGKPGAGPEQWVIETQGGAGQVTSGIPVEVGRSALLVVKVQFGTGPDIFTLYVDPTPGRPEPSSSVTKTGPDLGVVSKIGIFSTGAFVIDEIRIGETWDDVVPSGPELSKCL